MLTTYHFHNPWSRWRNKRWMNQEEMHEGHVWVRRRYEPPSTSVWPTCLQVPSLTHRRQGWQHQSLFEPCCSFASLLSHWNLHLRLTTGTKKSTYAKHSCSVAGCNFQVQRLGLHCISLDYLQRCHLVTMKIPQQSVNIISRVPYAISYVCLMPSDDIIKDSIKVIKTVQFWKLFWKLSGQC